MPECGPLIIKRLRKECQINQVLNSTINLDALMNLILERTAHLEAQTAYRSFC